VQDRQILGMVQHRQAAIGGLEGVADLDGFAIARSSTHESPWGSVSVSAPL
jgi:hypothetical protein